MNNKVDGLIDYLKYASTDNYFENTKVFLIENHIYNRECINIFVEEVKNRLDAKNRAVSLLGNLLIPIILGYLLFLLENEWIRSSPLFFAIAILIMVIFVSFIFGLTNWFIGKSGYIWSLRSMIGALYEIELDIIVSDAKDK